jgi:hypothetical protein
MCRLVHEWHTKCPFSQDFPPVVSLDWPQLSQVRLAIGFLSYLFVPAITHDCRRDNRMRQFLGNPDLLREIDDCVFLVRGDDPVGEHHVAGVRERRLPQTRRKCRRGQGDRLLAELMRGVVGKAQDRVILLRRVGREEGFKKQRERILRISSSETWPSALTAATTIVMRACCGLNVTVLEPRSLSNRPSHSPLSNPLQLTPALVTTSLRAIPGKMPTA